MDDKWLLNCVEELAFDIVNWRRHLHANPELSFFEYKTSDYIAEKLKMIPGMKVEKGVGLETAVIGTLSRGAGSAVAFRADMDALPIHEETIHSFRSQKEGVMHACGHDAHTAIGLAVATLIGDVWESSELEGTVKFIFQPAEEASDESGKTGASYLVEAGVLAGVDCILALHMSPEHEVGKVLIHDGYSMANVDVFEATIYGSGGHGAYPHLGTDPIWMLGPVMQALHGIVARKISPLDSAVISIGEIRGGSASNIIPSEVFLQGTLRSYLPDVRVRLIQELEKSFSIVKALGGQYSLKVIKGEPALYNHPEVNKLLLTTVERLYPAIKIESEPFGLGGEDFSHMTKVVPGAMFFLGCAYQDGVKRDLHTPIFDIDEKCLPMGAAIITGAILNYLLEKNHQPQIINHVSRCLSKGGGRYI